MEKISHKQPETEDIGNEKYSYNLSREFKFEICDFKVTHKITLTKHINTKHPRTVTVTHFV